MAAVKRNVWAEKATAVLRAPVVYIDNRGSVYAFPLSYALQCENVIISAWENLAEYEENKEDDGYVALKLLEYGSPEDPLFELFVVDKGIVYAALSPIDPHCVCKWATDATDGTFYVLPDWQSPCGLPHHAQTARKLDAMDRLLPLIPRKDKGYYKRTIKELEQEAASIDHDVLARDLNDTLVSMMEDAGVA